MVGFEPIPGKFFTIHTGTLEKTYPVREREEREKRKGNENIQTL
jgi:hypothetical protein